LTNVNFLYVLRCYFLHQNYIRGRRPTNLGNLQAYSAPLYTP